MRKIILIGVALAAVGALIETDEDRKRDGNDPHLASFLAALAIEAGIFLLRRRQNAILVKPNIS